LRKRLAVADFEELHPGDAALLVRFVRPDTHIVFRGASNHAGSAPCAFIQIDNHAVFVFALFLFHHLPRHKPFLGGERLIFYA
jgi:hypothetical protein